MENIKLDLNSEMGMRVASLKGFDVMEVASACFGKLNEEERNAVDKATISILDKVNEQIKIEARAFDGGRNTMAKGIAMNTMVLLDLMLNWGVMFDKLALIMEIDELEGDWNGERDDNR